MGVYYYFVTLNIIDTINTGFLSGYRVNGAAGKS